MSDDVKRTDEQDGVLDESEMSQIVGGSGPQSSNNPGPTLDEAAKELQKDRKEIDFPLPTP